MQYFFRGIFYGHALLWVWEDCIFLTLLHSHEFNRVPRWKWKRLIVRSKRLVFLNLKTVSFGFNFYEVRILMLNLSVRYAFMASTIFPLLCQHQLETNRKDENFWNACLVDFSKLYRWCFTTNYLSTYKEFFFSNSNILCNEVGIRFF